MKKGDWLPIFKAFLAAQGVLREFTRLFKGYYGNDYKNIDEMYSKHKFPEHWVEDAFPWENAGENGNDKWARINSMWNDKYKNGK